MDVPILYLPHMGKGHQLDIRGTSLYKNPESSPTHESKNFKATTDLNSTEWLAVQEAVGSQGNEEDGTAPNAHSAVSSKFDFTAVMK